MLEESEREQEEDAGGVAVADAEPTTPPTDSDTDQGEDAGEITPEEMGGEGGSGSGDAGSASVAPMTPAPEPTPTARDMRDEFIQSVMEKARQAQSLRLQIEMVKEDLKGLKERLDIANTDLERLGLRGVDPQQRLPFGDDAKKEAAAPATSEEADATTTTDAVAASEVNHADDDEWRGTPLTELGLSNKILDALGDARLTTMGELADYCSKEHNRLIDIPKIGPAKAEQIEQACERFWAERTATATA